MAFNENTRVKIPAILHLTRLGYEYVSLKNAIRDEDTNIFTEIFSESINRINSTQKRANSINPNISNISKTDTNNESLAADIPSPLYKINNANKSIDTQKS